jgi:hypothetical protein
LIHTFRLISSELSVLQNNNLSGITRGWFSPSESSQ